MRIAAFLVVVPLLSITTAYPGFGGQLEDAQATYERGDYREAYRLFMPLAEQGNAEAQYRLGNIFGFGLGLPLDYDEAVKWYRKAAEQGYGSAQNSLGYMYQLGLGIQQDNAKAVKWYRKAAEQGNKVAQVNLGDMYKDGKGVPRNYVQAYMWYQIVVTQSSAVDELYLWSGKERLDSVASRMTPAQIVEAERLAREWKPEKEVR